MAPITLVIFLGLLALAQAAFKIPPGQPDGVYKHHVDEKGNHVHAKLANTAPAPHQWTKPGKQRKRWDYGSYKDGVNCQANGAIVDMTDVNRAAYNLGASCDASSGDKFIAGSKGDRYAKAGDAVVYVCNYSSNSQHCKSSELQSDIPQIQNTCTAGVAGKLTPYIV
jgi:hypothetical protein